MKRRTRRGDKKSSRCGSHGIITIFVTLIMVPVVAVTGIMVDATRLKMYSSQSVMAADSFGEAVLSEYDNLLKELYGLFSVTQNEEGLAAIEELNKYMKYSFNPDGDSKGLSGFMPYKDADIQLSYEKVEGASLWNNNVLMTQIGDFMKFRVVQEVAEGLGMLDGLGQIQSYEKDMEAMEARTDITDSGMKALEKIQAYYQQLKILSEYPSFLAGRKDDFELYAAELNAIVDSDDYAKYYNYMEHEDAIKEACEKYDRIQAQKTEEEEEPEEEEESEGASSMDSEPKETMTPEEEELRSQYVDVNAYSAGFGKEAAAKITARRTAAVNFDSFPIDFDNAGEIIDSLGEIADELDGVLTKLSEQMAVLRTKLVNCSEEMRTGIQEEIKDLEQIIKYANEFHDTYVLISQTYNDRAKNLDNMRKIEEGLEKLNNASEAILNGRQPSGKKTWPQSVDLEWGDFMTMKSDFFQMLKKQCEVDGSGTEGDKSAGDKEIKHANGAQEEAEKKLNEMSDDTPARDINNSLAQELRTGTSSAEVPGLLDSFSGGLSFEALGETGTVILDKFMVAAYDFGMFSSRVTGVDTNASNEAYADYSLTKVKMSDAVNYLYGAELEYIFGGHNESKKNLNEVRNIICGVRLTLNFISTYVIRDINTIISEISTAAAGLGGPFAPLVKVAVSGALRAAFAAIETAQDWSLLMERKSIVLLKKNMNDLSAISLIQGLLGDKVKKTGGGKPSGLQLSYENYLFILLCLFVDHNTLLQRTSDLVTLNVNQAARQDKEPELTKLEFKMENTVTAIKSTCKVKMDFVVVPENFMELFLKGTGAESKIEFLENHYYGYSVIRGY